MFRPCKQISCAPRPSCPQMSKDVHRCPQDYKGITPLGYAIGANRIAVVKLLLDSRANPYAVDSSGNSGLHYAAGYGRRELLEWLGSHLKRSRPTHLPEGNKVLL